MSVQDLDKGIMNALKGNDPDEIVPTGDEQNPDVSNGDGNDNGVSNEFTPSPFWDFIKTKKGEEFKMPEDISSENEMEILDTHFKEIYSPKEEDVYRDINPTIKPLIEASKQPDFDLNRYISSIYESTNKVNLSDDDLLIEEYKKTLLKSETNPDGFTEEEIVTNVKNLDAFSKRERANKVRESLKANTVTSISPEEKLNQINKYNNELLKNATEQVFTVTPENEKSKRSILGIDIGKDNFDKLKDTYIDYFKINPETGNYKFNEEVLSNDDVILEIVKYLTYRDKVQENLGKMLVEERNNGRKSVFDTMFLTPQEDTPSYKSDNEIDEESIMNRLRSN